MTASHSAAWSALTDFTGRQQAKHQVPGVVLGVLHHGEVSAQGFGVTNVDHPLPVTDTTLYQIGSITKTLTGTLIMQLVEEGKLDLDAPVRRYVPDFRVADEAAAANATLRHLLTHLSGWEGDLFLETGSGDDALARYVAMMAEQTQLAPQGRYWSYNNAGFAVLGYVVERVLGVTFETALRTRLLEPLGMTHSYCFPTEAMTQRFVVGHMGTPDGPTVMRPWQLARASMSMGGLITDVRDLLRYAQFHLGDMPEAFTSGAVAPPLSAAGIAAMRVPQAPVYGDEQWGLSWGLNHVDGVQLVHHSGGTVGQITMLTLAPERRFAVAVLTNAQHGAAVTRSVTEFALDAYLGVKLPRPAPQEIDAAGLAVYAGRYANAFTEMEVGVLGGRLIAQYVPKGGFPTRETPPAPAPPPMTLGVIAADRLLVLDGGLRDTKIDVVHLPDGTIGWLRMGSRLLRHSPKA